MTTHFKLMIPKHTKASEGKTQPPPAEEKCWRESHGWPSATIPNLGSEFLVAFSDQTGKSQTCFRIISYLECRWIYQSLQKHTRQHLNHFIIVPPNWHLQVEAFDTKSQSYRGVWTPDPGPFPRSTCHSGTVWWFNKMCLLATLNLSTDCSSPKLALPVNSHRCRAVLEFSARKTGPT